MKGFQWDRIGLKKIRVGKYYRLVTNDNALIYLDIILFYLNIPVLYVGIVYTLKTLPRTPLFVACHNSIEITICYGNTSRQKLPSMILA
jgi:hypothetical protein